VSVPLDAKIAVTMQADTWAFGKVQGKVAK